jgi:hypothetical protein
MSLMIYRTQGIIKKVEVVGLGGLYWLVSGISCTCLKTWEKLNASLLLLAEDQEM